MDTCQTFQISLIMDSASTPNLQEALKNIDWNYLEIFRDYRNHGYLDSDLWTEDFQIDYVLEVILANFSITNLLCEQLMEEVMISPRSIDELGDEFMPDYNLGYALSQDCSAVISYANSNKLHVRDSLITELFYAHIQYFNHSLTGNRMGWFDVNKRLLSSMVELIIFDKGLLELIDEWSEDIEFIDAVESKGDVDDGLVWKREFVDCIFESLDQIEK